MDETTLGSIIGGGIAAGGVLYKVLDRLMPGKNGQDATRTGRVDALLEQLVAQQGTMVQLLNEIVSEQRVHSKQLDMIERRQEEGARV